MSGRSQLQHAGHIRFAGYESQILGVLPVRNLANWLLLLSDPLYQDVQHAVLPARTIYVIMMAGYKSDLVERS
jgi:hypothetical protein